MSGRGHDERGFTMIELMVTLAVASLVMTGIVGVLVSQTNAERRVSIFAGNQEEMRLAVIAMQRDLRSSEPLAELASSVDYGVKVELDVYDSIDGPTSSRVRWVVDPTARELRREALDGTGAVIGVTYRLRGVVNDAGRPLFRLYKANGAQYTPGVDQPSDIARCTVRVRIELVAAPEAGPEPGTLLSDVHLRNRLPGGTGCPEVPLTTVAP